MTRAGLRGVVPSRVLVVGEAGCCQRLRAVLPELELLEGGDRLEAVEARAAAIGAELLLVADPGPACLDRVGRLRQSATLRSLALLALGPADQAAALRAAGADEVLHAEEVEALRDRLEQALRLKRLADAEALCRSRFEALVELAELSAAGLALEELLPRAMQVLAKVLPGDRCSVVLGEGPRTATVVATSIHSGGFNLTIDLARYPEIKKSLSTREPVLVDDASKDPLLAEVRPLIDAKSVRSILVQPLIWQEEQLGVLFLRSARQEGAYGQEELDFSRAAASVLASLVRTARHRQLLRQQRDQMEAAYVDRYQELLEANQRLKGLNHFKDEMLAVCSHDLRGPLHVMMGHLRLLQYAELSGQAAASVQSIAGQSRKVLELVERLLERARGDAARMTLEPEELDLAALCRELAAEHEILGADRGVSIAVKAPERSGLLADRVKLRQVLQNLLANALAHARLGGEVRLALEEVDRPEGRQLRVTVEDDGPGIPADELALVFDKYRHGPGGVGLGLAICREYVEMHAGEIWAENRAEGGARVVFTLPHTDARLPGEGLNDGARSRVLLVEDEPQVAAVTAELLRSRYRVELACDGAEAIAKARALQPDLILMDVFLPRVDGLDAAAALQASPDTGDIPVILVSAHHGIAEKVRALNLGAVDYLAKPYQSSELFERVGNALAKRAQGLHHKRLEKLRRAGADPATGLLEPASFAQRLAQELSRARHYAREVALVGFIPRQSVEPSRLGPAAGAFQTALRASDLLGHLGRGRFAAFLPDIAPATARAVCGRVAAALEQTLGVPIETRIFDLGNGSQDIESLLASLRPQPEP